MTWSRDVFLYGDLDRPEDREISDYLVEMKVPFTTIPVAGGVPEVSMGSCRLVGKEEVYSTVPVILNLWNDGFEVREL